MHNIVSADGSINLREVITKYSYHWKLFLLGILFAVTCAFIYLNFATYEYSVSSTILINDEDNDGGSSSEIAAFQDLGLFEGPKTSLDTEIGILKSKTIIEKVVAELKLNVTYYKKDVILSQELYKEEVPFKVNFFVNDSILNLLNTEFSIKTTSETTYILYNSEGEETTNAFFGEKVSGEFSDLVITPIDIENVEVDQKILIKVVPLVETAIVLKKRIEIVQDNLKSNLLILTLQDSKKIRAKEVLDNLVLFYNNDAILKNNRIAKKTDEFISSRIDDVLLELTSLDQGVQSYKTENFLSNLDSESSVAMNSNALLANQISELTSRIKLIDYVTEYMKTNTNDLIPANLGLLNETTSQNTINYNNLVLERNRLLTSANKENPLVANIINQITSLRVSIDRSLVNIRSSLAISLEEARSQENKLNSKISATPRKEREIRDIQRQQEIYETLYLYLLQKKEENSISLAVSAPNAEIIDKAYGSDVAIAPRKLIVLLSSLLLGFLLPLFYLIGKSLLDNKIHTLEDVEHTIEAPILGDIPVMDSKNNLIDFKTDRNNVSESLRLLRTNINYMLPNEHGKGKSIFITSTISGEGKTFIAINLAMAFTLLNKKVLLIGADIRKPRISKYLNIRKEKGLTHFLNNPNLEVSEVIFPQERKLDIVIAGDTPPNPSELLTNGRFNDMIRHGKTNYDYVIVDTAPVNLATDTLLLSHFANLFVYVIRADFLTKRMLKIPKNMFENKRLPNMTIVLNGVNYKKRGYSNTESYGENSTKSWLKRVFK